MKCEVCNSENGKYELSRKSINSNVDLVAYSCHDCHHVYKPRQEYTKEALDRYPKLQNREQYAEQKKAELAYYNTMPDSTAKQKEKEKEAILDQKAISNCPGGPCGGCLLKSKCDKAHN